jgi:drug/metabolite transporter (DMT)-like permease/ribosomal protein S18 acetylase RimI-like enzyme
MHASNTKAYLALAVVCFVWGTTYLAIRIGVSSFPPFLFSAVRQLSAGALLLIFLKLAGTKLTITRREIWQQAFAGVLLLAFGNGLIAWAERYIPSGLAALLVAIMPVYIVLINAVASGGRERPNWKVSIGLLLGCVGLVLIFRDNLADLANRAYLLGIGVALLASFCWAVGTVYTKRRRSMANAFVNAGVQMLSGGVALLLMSIFLDDYSELSTLTADSLWALAYLIVFGSIISYGCYLYALERLPAGLISVYAYINPLVAILLGYFILDEKLTWLTALAFGTIVTGVFFMNRGYKVQKPAVKQELEPEAESSTNSDIQIVKYHPALRIHFEQLNKAWIEKSFRLEPIDEWVLTHPEEAILKDGGSILFAQKQEQIIGAVALRKVGQGTFEMTKMAVDENFRGLGAGKLLIDAAINKAAAEQAERLILYSNTRANAPAIRLYRAAGFEEVPLEDGTYERADIKMEIAFKPALQAQ